MFPLSYENIISECSLNVQNACFFYCVKNVFVAYTNITRTFNLTILQALWEPYFWMFSDILKQVFTFKQQQQNVPWTKCK